MPHIYELIASYSSTTSQACLSDWRQACERIYKFMSVVLSDDGFGNGISWVISDSLCNLHLTSTECFERAVRLPAAMRAAKEVAANNSSRLRIMKAVRHRYLEMAEKEVIKRAHTNSYLRRMKKKCQSVTTEGEIVSLTADSDNNGGEDTSTSAMISTCGQRFQILSSRCRTHHAYLSCTLQRGRKDLGRQLLPP